MHDNTLTDDNRNKFIQIANRYGASLKFYNVEELCADKINRYVELVPSVKTTRVSRAAFYKFLIPEILDKNIEKVIYLDSDIIVNLDINSLWQIELEDYPIAAVKNPFSPGVDPLRVSGLLCDGFAKVEDYFNSGVMVMNLKVLRNEQESIFSGIKFRGEKLKYTLFDQEIFNYLFSTRNLKLPIEFNSLVKQTRGYGDLTIKKAIYHYAAGKYGLGIDISDSFNRLWWSYFIMTPWFSVDTIDKIINDTSYSMLKLSEVPPSKTRVFIVDEQHAYQIEKNFSVQDEEEVIVVDTESEDSLQSLTDLMDNGKGKKIFFIGVPNIAPKLEKMRFVEGKDFFNVSAFYSPAWANLTNNYNLILEM